jgi:hypothetical protein
MEVKYNIILGWLSKYVSILINFSEFSSSWARWLTKKIAPIRRDGKNNIFRIAFGVADKEDTTSR